MSIPLFVLIAGLSVVLASPENNIGHNVVVNASTYYSVRRTYSSLGGRYPELFSSEDLLTWDYVTDIFNNKTAAAWTAPGPYTDLEINVIGKDKVRVYFAALEKYTKYTAIGVGFSDEINPKPFKYYSTVYQPLLSDKEANLHSPSLILPAENPESNNPLLVYMSGSADYVMGVLLTADGLQAINSGVKLLEPTRAWEGGAFTKVWGLHKNGKFYIFYLGEDGTSVGVARSAMHLGPYEKKGQPIGTKNSQSKSFLHNELVWGADGWPHLSSVLFM